MGNKECRGTLFGSYIIWGPKSVLVSARTVAVKKVPVPFT